MIINFLIINPFETHSVLVCVAKKTKINKMFSFSFELEIDGCRRIQKDNMPKTLSAVCKTI